MKVLHYSDRYDPVFLRLYAECDVLVTTGDLSGSDFAGIELINPRKSAFGVYGNHDQGDYMSELRIVNLHLKTVEFGGLVWGGWQGCLKYKEGSAPLFTEDLAREFADTFPRVDVLLLHAGPKGMLDEATDEYHIGSPSIRRYVLEKKPRVVFCGHQYSRAETEIEGVKIYRGFGAGIIEIDTK